MAILDKKGVIHGSVSNIVYRSWRDLNVVQLKPSKVKRTLASQEAGVEFGLCSNTAREIRKAFARSYKAYDSRMINRFSTAVRRSIYASARKRGERDIHDADLSFLKGFQFNGNSPLDSVLRVRPSATLGDDGKVLVHLPPIRHTDIRSPRARGYILRLLLLAFDFGQARYNEVGLKELKISSSQPFEGGDLAFEKEAPRGRLLILCMSVHAYVWVHQEIEFINSASWSPAELIGLWQLPRDPTLNAKKSAEDFIMEYDGATAIAQIAELREKAK